MVSSSSTGVTVLICSRNGRNNLPKTLASLAVQRVTRSFGWEVILVDNASTDDTKTVARDLWKGFNVPIPLTVATESKPGKNNAIDLGMRLARFDYVLICDDDNWLREDYLETAYTIMSTHPSIGILGGYGIPVFEQDTPGWFSVYESSYAVGKQNDFNGEIEPTLDMRYIWGAGSVINKNAYQILLDAGFQRLITHERFPEFSRCEDVEMSHAMQLAGFKLWYDNRLIFHHFIHAEKLTWSYLLDMAKGGALARPYLLLYSALRVVNIDTKENHQYDAYRTLWQQHKFRYVRTVIRSILTPKNLIATLRIALGQNREGDHDHFLNLVRLYFLFSWLKLTKRHFKIIFSQLATLKNNISPHY